MHNVHYRVNAQRAFANRTLRMQPMHMNLRKIREAKGFSSQAALAEVLGVNQSTVQRMEASEPSVTLNQFINAANYLGVTLAEIFADERSDAETRLLLHWRSLPVNEQLRWSEHLRLAAGKPPEDAAESH